MKISGVSFYQAHSSNYSKGRTQPIRFITIHHSAGWEQTLRYLWSDPNRNGSSHFWVGKDKIEQYVDTDDTAWTNGNWKSNSESITIEVRGDWRGYYDQSTLNQLEKLLQTLRKKYPNVQISYHQDVSDRFTLCPADLKHKGHAKKVWDKVTTWLQPKPPTPSITYKPIAPKRVQLTRTANLWNFNAKTWDQVNKQAVKTFGKGHVVDVVAVATNQLGSKYYMTAYSYNNGSIRATNGFNIADVKDYVPAITQPPTVEPKWEKMTSPRKLKTTQDLFVTNLDTMQNQGDIIPAGKKIDFVMKKTLKNNIMYLQSQWAHINEKNWGIRMDMLEEILDVPREPVPEPPIKVDPETPTDSDFDKRLNALEALIKKIYEFLTNMFGSNK